MRTVLFGILILMQGTGAAYAQVPQVEEAATPGYPRLPSGGREGGEVQVEVAINPSGEVVSAKAVSGPDRLRAIAESAARKWRFRSQDKATEKWTITFAFIPRPGVGEPPAISAILKAPNRVEVFGEGRKVVTIADPPVEDVDKARKKNQK
jgi:TonB family protein